MIELDHIRRLPKVSLHDHLDGGLRPATIIELAPDDHALPATEPEALRRWFFEAADSGSLVRYLETFDHTIAVMQTRDNLRRVAREFVEDMVADGVVYAETRWAPEQHLRQGLTMTEVITAVGEGLGEGMAAAAEAGTPIIARQLITGMRQTQTSREVAELVLTGGAQQVAGFDIAGPEDGFPPGLHREAFARLREEHAWFTIHAGEAAGLESIREAVQFGAHRIGHGVRIMDDITRDAAGDWQLGRLASYIRDRRIPLEVCPSSNLQTGAATSLADHPIDVLYRLGFRVSVNCDNRLMSDTTMSGEFAKLAETFGWTVTDIGRLTSNAAKSAFLPYPQRRHLLDQVIRPAYA